MLGGLLQLPPFLYGHAALFPNVCSLSAKVKRFEVKVSGPMARHTHILLLIPLARKNGPLATPPARRTSASPTSASPNVRAP